MRGEVTPLCNCHDSKKSRWTVHHVSEVHVTGILLNKRRKNRINWTDYISERDVELWATTPETHKYATAAGSFCFVTTENGDQRDIYNLTTVPCVQQSVYLDELTVDFGSTKVEVPGRVDGRTRDVLERCMTTCGKAAGIIAKKEIPCTEGSITSRTRILQTVRWSKTLTGQILRRQWGFWSHQPVGSQAEKLCNRKMGAHHQDGQTRWLP